MKRREFYERMSRIDPEAPDAMDALADLFEEDYVSSGRELSDPAVAEEIIDRAKADLEDFQTRYDALCEKINADLRKAGATEAQINWGLFGNVELGTAAWLRCNRRARKLIRYAYQILYCLAELKMIGRYAETEVDDADLNRIRQDYGRRYG